MMNELGFSMSHCCPLVSLSSGLIMVTEIRTLKIKKIKKEYCKNIQ